MANIVSAQTGFFHEGSTWVGGVIPHPINDDAFVASTHVVYISGNQQCKSLNRQAGGTTGRFIAVNNSSFSGNINGSFNTTEILGLTGNTTFTITNTTIIGGSVDNARAVLCSGDNNILNATGVFQGGSREQTGAIVIASNSSTTLNVVGTIRGGTGWTATHALINFSSLGRMFVTGEANAGGTTGDGVNMTGGFLQFTGFVYGGNTTANASKGIRSISSASQIIIIGNVRGSSSSTIFTGSAGIGMNGGDNLLVYGNVEGTNASPGIDMNTGFTLQPNIRISGNIINSANGSAAIYAPSYRVDPIPANSYIRYARNGTGVGSDAYLYQFTTDSLSAFSMPPVSAVRFGTSFANNTLTGTCVVPSPSSVAFGVPVDNTVGQAVLMTNTLFDVPLSAINTLDSIGLRVKSAATTEAVGHLIASFTQY